MADEILAAALELPGGSWTKIRDRVRGNATEAAAVRDHLIRDGLLVNQAARKGQFELWSASDPAATRSELRTGVERLPFHSPDTEAADVPVPPFQRSIRNGGTGTERPTGVRLGDEGYLKSKFAAFEAGLMTEAEWKQADRAHRFVVQSKSAA